MRLLSRRCAVAAGILVPIAAVIAGCSYFRGPARPNVLLITLDTTRADRIGCYGYEAARTPVLDQFARDGVLFERAYSPAPLTLPVHASLMTGLYPPEHGLRTNGAGSLPNERNTLSEMLLKEGYDTGAFVASFVLDGKFGLKQGFQVYDDQLVGAHPTQDALHRYREGRLVVDSALKWLQKPRSKPFFCWVHLYDPHAPYDAHSAEFDGAFDDSPYDGEIAYTDQQVGRLIDFLKQHPNTYVIIAGDHGESLGDHSEMAHGYTLYQSTQHVPLMMRGLPNSKPGTRVTGTVALVDVLPTLLDSLQMPTPAGISGRSFVASLAGGAVSPRTCFAMTDDPFLQNGWSPLQALITDRWKYIRTAKPELYDLVADPRELVNLAEQNPRQLEELQSQLADLEAGLTIGNAVDVQLSDKEQKTLRGLGYIGNAGSQQVPAVNDLPDVKDMLPWNLRMQTAIDLMERNQLSEAEVIFQEIVQGTPPAHSSSRLYLGSVYEQQGRFPEAEELYRGVLESRPDDTNALFHLGGMLADQGKLTEAIRIFQKCQELEPDSAQPLFNLGLAHAKLNDVEQAERDFHEGLQLDPAFPGIWSALGSLLARQGRAEEALAAFESELEFNPVSVEAHVNLGVCLSDQSRLEDALPHFEEAVRLAPNSVEAQMNLGVCLMMMGKFDAAEQRLQAAIERNPQATSLQLTLGNVYRKSEQFDKAIQAYEAELRVNADSLEAHVNLGALFGRREQWEQATIHLQAAAKVSPGNPDVHYNLAICCLKKNDPETAVMHLERTLKLKPDHAPAAAELKRLQGQ